jgi:hypothetical protein
LRAGPGARYINVPTVLTLPVIEDCLTTTEEAAAHAIEADFEALFARWLDRGFPRNVVVPMAFLVAVDTAKRAGISFESAADTLRMIWFGDTPN